MKHFFPAAVSALLLLLLCACGTLPAPAPTPAPAESPKIYSVQTFNKTGKIQKEEFYSYDAAGMGRVTATTAYSYTDTGRLLSAKTTSEKSDYGIVAENYVYSGDLWTQHTVYDKNGAAEETRTRTYYPSGAVKTEQTIIPFIEGKNLEKTDETCIYSEDGVLTEKIVVGKSAYEKHEYIYDEETGLLLTENIYNSNTGKKNDYMLFNAVSYGYDMETGLPVSCVRTALGGAVESVTVYQYNENGKPVYIADYSDETLSDAAFLSSQIFEYDAAGNCTLKADMNTDGSGWKTSREYDERGNVIYEAQLTFFGESETRLNTVETEYDGHGNPVKQVEKAFDGNTVERTWSYDYYESGTLRTVTRFADK